MALDRPSIAQQSTSLEDAPEEEEEETGAQEDQKESPEDQIVDIPDPESLQEEPEGLKRYRSKYLKGLRLQGKILRGEYTQKLITWSPWHDDRSVEYENENGHTEEMFFDEENAERNLRKLLDQYLEELREFRGEKISEFVQNTLPNIPDDQRDTAITKFSQNLLAAQQANHNEAFESQEDSFDENKFRDWWYKDSTRYGRIASSLGLVGAGVATGGAAPLAARGAMSGVGAAVGTEAYLEQTDNRLFETFSRRGPTAEIQSQLDDEASQEDIDAAIEEHFSQPNEDLANRDIKNEASRLRMLANELGTTVEQAAAGSDNLTARIIERLQEKEREIMADNVLAETEDIEDPEVAEDEAVSQAMMDVFERNEQHINTRMEEESRQERYKKMKRKLAAAGVGAGFGWVVGSGTLGNWISNTADAADDAWGWLWSSEAGAEATEEAFDTHMQPDEHEAFQDYMRDGEIPEWLQQPAEGGETKDIISVDISSWEGGSVAGDTRQARSFIEATSDIQKQLDQVDLSGHEGLQNLKEFMQGDTANNLAEQLEGYQPEDIKESLVVKEGDTLSVTNQGDLVLEHADGKQDVLFDGQSGKVNKDALTDDTFGDFDDTSGSEQPPEAPEDTADAQDQQTENQAKPNPSTIEPAGLEYGLDEKQIRNITDVNASTPAEMVQVNMQEANGLLKGALQSYLDAGGDVAYAENINLPQGMSQQEFTSNLRDIENVNQLIDKLPEMAQNQPQRLQTLNALFDGFHEYNLNASWSGNITHNQDLETLYSAVDAYLDDPTEFEVGGEQAAGGNTPEPPHADNQQSGIEVTTGEDAAPSADGEAAGEGQTGPNNGGQAQAAEQAPVVETANLQNIEPLPSDVNSDQETWNFVQGRDAGTVFRSQNGDTLYVRTTAQSGEMQQAIDKARSLAEQELLSELNLKEGQDLPGYLRTERQVPTQLNDGNYAGNVLVELDLPDQATETASGATQNAADAGAQTGEATGTQSTAGSANSSPGETPNADTQSGGEQAGAQAAESSSSQLSQSEIVAENVSNSEQAEKIERLVDNGQIPDDYPRSLTEFFHSKVGLGMSPELRSVQMDGSQLITEDRLASLRTFFAQNENVSLRDQVADLVQQVGVDTISKGEPNQLHALAALTEYHSSLPDDAVTFSSEASQEAAQELNKYVEQAISEAGGTPPQTPEE